MFKIIGILALISVNILAIAAAPTTEISFDKLVEKVTQNFFGMHCISNVIMEVDAGAGDFVYDLEVCDDPYTVADYIDIVDTKDIINKLSDKLLFVNEAVCGNHQYLPDWNGATIPEPSCLYKFRRQLYKLDHIINETLTEIAVANETNICAVMAMGKYVVKLNNFREFLHVCGEVADHFHKNR